MGFDNECILNIQSLAGEYFCPVCRLLVYPNEAIQSQCTHLYCKPCLTYIVSTTRACPYDGYLVTEADSKPLVESNKALAETIGKVAVHCLYHRSGCTWQGPLSDCTSHCSSCAFGNSPVVCNRCGIQIVHRQVQEHAQNCPGVQPQAPQAEAGQDASASGTAVAVDQSQTVTQAGAATSQAQISQAAAVTSVQDNNSQVNSNPQVQAVAQPAVLTQEQWYQQQQQYQQYYQQYPGYDPYQQHYQQYYPYQQQAVQQYQQQHLQGQPQLVPGQPPPQVYAQPQAQPQPPAHSQTQPQIQIQPPSQPQPQPQPQPHPHVQAPVVAQNQTQTPVNPQQQLHPVVQPHSQIPSQILPPPHGQPQPQPQPYSQAQTYAQPHPVQPYAAQHPQMPQYQQPHPQMQHPQSQLQPQPHSQHPQHHPPPQPQSQPHPQVAPQAQVQHHAQLHNQPRPAQPTPTPNPTAHPQIQHTSALAVTGHHSYPQPQPYQQMQSGALQQHSIHMHSQSGSHQQPQHPGQMQGQFPPQPPQMRPPQSHVPMPNQQQPALLPSPGPVPNMPPAQPQPAYPHGLQPGHPAQQRPVMQSMQQQPLPPQFVQQQQQAFPGQPLGLALNQLHQQAPFVQQQQPIQSPIRPQGPPQSLQQLPGYPQSQQSAALSHGLQSQQPLNHIGRPMIPNQGLPSQPYPQSHGGVTGAAHVRPLLPSSGQLPATQNYPPRANSQLQSSSEQQLGYIQQSAHSQSAATSKTTVFEKQGDNISEKNVAERDADSASQKTDRKDGSGLVVTSDPGADSVDLKSLKSESDIKSVGDEKKQEIQNDKSPSIVESMHAQTAEPETHATEYGLDPVVKQMVKRESANNTLETSATGKSVESVVEQKVVSDVEPKQGGHSFEGKEIQEGSLSKSPLGKQLEFVEDKRGKLQNDAVDSLTRADKGLQFVPPASVPISSNSVQIAQSKGQIPGSEGGSLQTPPFSRDTLHHQERNMPQGPGVDEYRGFPPPGQAQGKGFAHPSHSVPHTDPGRHQLPPMPYGPSHQQRPDASLMLPVPPQGPLHQAQVPLQPPMQLRPHGPGPLSQPGQPFPPPEHLQPPLLNQPHGPFRPEIPPGGGFPSGGPALPLGRGPGHMGPNQRNFEPRSITPQGPYNQGHMPPPHAGAPRTSQGELVGGPPFGGPPPRGSFDSPGVMMARPPQHGPDAHAGLQRPTNPMEAEMFPNQRPGYFDSRHSDSHLPGSLERGPIGLSKMNGPSGPDSSSALGLRNGRFKPLPEDHVNSFPMEPNRRVSDRVEYEDDLRQFPRPSNLDMEPGLKSTGNISSLRPVDRGPHGLGMDAALRPLEKAPHGFNYDGVVKLDSNASTGPPRFHPPFHPSGTLHPNDAGERSRPLDIGGRVDHPYSRPDFLEQVPGFGRHHVDGRSPAREYPGAPSRGFGGLTGAVGNRSGTDDVDGRESGRFGEGSKPFNLSLDPIGNTFNESRYAGLPSRMRRSDLDGPGNLRTGEHFPPGPHSHLRNSDSLGQDSLPSHLRRGEHFGPRNLPSHLRLGEPAGFGAFPGHAQVDLPGIGNFPQNVPFGESFRGGNKPNHPRLGEPGFRSSYSLQGFSNDSGFFKGDMEPFDNSRKRKSSSMGWCRICKVDCETVEGLDLHSQTREHQKMAMDMVLSIKQQNAKKHKTSNDHSSLEEASKSRNASLDGRSNKH